MSINDLLVFATGGRFAAVLISPALAPGLKVEAGTAALEVRRTYKMSDGGVAQVTINTHPASRFRHSMTLRRVRG
jgi:DNA-binding GntR family transcriptional regulator